MIYTFPHFGPAAVTAAKLLDALHIEYVMPGMNSKEMLERGAAISPEEMCIPFKYMVGNLIDAYEKGADTAVMTATAGPCRLGEYGQLMIEVLKRNGYDYSWILLDTAAEIGTTNFLRRLNMVFNFKENGAIGVGKLLLRGWRFVRRYDNLRRRAALEAGYLKEPYEAVRLRRETKEAILKERSFDGCGKLLDEAEKKLAAFSRREAAEPVKILVTGEIYTSMEDELNCGLEEKLMMLGCSVSCHIDLSWWIKHTITSSLLPRRLTKNAEKQGIDCNIGGYGRQTAAAVLDSDSFDGVIKIMPAGCMPEIVTKAFCEELRRKKDIRMIHLIYDEMSGEAGYDTRIEAFVDMLERRRHVLAGNRHRIDKHRSGADR